MTQFTVDSWHTHAPSYWLARNAWTIMASPPPWARAQHRNLELFAPPAFIVFGYQDQTVSQSHYTTVYRAVMRQRLPAVKTWLQRVDGQHMTLLCACPEGKFCHRQLVRKLLLWLGCEEVPRDA